MRTVAAALCALAVCPVLVAAQPRAEKTLDIFIIDVEGGNAQLYVSPAGESVLIDAGNGGAAAVRDAGRIMEAARAAGLKRIDYLVTTHYHGDHVGGLAEVVRRLPVAEFIDHGENVQSGPQIDPILETYATLYGAAKHRVVKPGDRIPLKDLDWRIVSAGGHVLETATPGAGKPNPYCADFRPHTVNPVSGQPVGNTEDEQSIGSLVTFGRFRALYLGDLPWNEEFKLNCPQNRLGSVDLFVVSRHGQPSSNSPVLVHAVQPRVIVMNNGFRKGGQPATMDVLFRSPRLENIWQLHFSVLGGQEYTAPGAFIANLDETSLSTAPAPAALPQAGAPPGQGASQHEGPAHWIKIAARADGSFTVTNSRNGFSKHYSASTTP